MFAFTFWEEVRFAFFQTVHALSSWPFPQEAIEISLFITSAH